MADEQRATCKSAAPVIRPVTPDDLPALKAIIDATGLFPSAMLDAMTAAYLSAAAPHDFWLTARADEEPVAVAYYAPERMTEGTWNLLVIAVHPNRQRRGIGAALMHHVETALAEVGERLLLVETSGLPAFAATRAFYHRIGYDEEACIRDYYQAGEDKVVFRKMLARASQGSAASSSEAASAPRSAE